MSAGVTRLYSASIFVSDVDEAIDFYVNKLGLTLRGDTPFDEEGHRWVEVLPEGADTAIILVKGFGSWTPERVGGDTGLLFSVRDMARAFERLEGQGVSFTREPYDTPYGIFAHAADPDGNEFMLHQDAPHRGGTP